MHYCGLSLYDTANGPGIRVSLFVSGCTLRCKGCFNEASWDFNHGNLFTTETQEKIFKTLENPYIKGLSILGGDPFEDKNVNDVLAFVRAFRHRFGDTKDLWIWSGRTKEQLENDPIKKAILSECDVLVDGPFIKKYQIVHKWYGSYNQKVHYLKKI